MHARKGRIRDSRESKGQGLASTSSRPTDRPVVQPKSNKRTARMHQAAQRELLEPCARQSRDLRTLARNSLDATRARNSVCATQNTPFAAAELALSGGTIRSFTSQVVIVRGVAKPG